MGIPESGRGKHGAGTAHRHAQHQTAARFGRRGARRGSGGSPVSRRDRKGDGPVARRRAAGGTHGGFRRRKLEPGDVAFGGAGTRTENEIEPVPAGFSGDFVLTAAGTEHVVNGTSITLTRSGRFALSVTARQLGYVSPAAYVTVESQDGEYLA